MTCRASDHGGLANQRADHGSQIAGGVSQAPMNRSPRQRENAALPRSRPSHGPGELGASASGSRTAQAVQRAQMASKPHVRSREFCSR